MSRTFLIYKPYKFLSQFTGEAGHSTLAELGLPKEVYPIGRLDKDSEGLLLISDDKRLNARILSPKRSIPKTYWAQVEGEPEEIQLEEMRSGLIIKHNKKPYRTKRCKAKVIEEPVLPERDPPIRFRMNKPTTWLEIELTEGKNRQIRQMTAKVGLPTLRLVRIAIGGLKMKEMKSGKVVELDETELDKVFA